MPQSYAEGFLLTSSIGEGRFDDDSGKPSGAATPVEVPAPGKKRKGVSKKAKSIREKLAIADGGA